MDGEIQLGTHLLLRPLVAWPVAAAVIVAVAAVMAAAAWRWTLPLAPRRRRVLHGLRGGVVAAVAMILLQPEVHWQGRRPVQSEVAVLLDASRSMAIRDAAAQGLPGPRIGAVREAFLTAGPAYTALAARTVLNPYAFGTHARPVGNFAPDPTDPRTDLGEALDFLVRRAGGAGGRDATGSSQTAANDHATPVTAAASSHLAAVVLISDGQANRGGGGAEESARLLADRGIAVHAVAVGSATPTGSVRDVAVRDLRAADRVFAGNRADVRAVVAALGLAGRRLEVVLTVNGREVDRRAVTPAGPRATQEVAFSPQLDTPGPARLAVSVAPLDDELIAPNNRAETTVRVEEGGLRVLYLDGRLHPEGKYVARVLGDAREIDLDRRLLVGPARQGDTAANAADAGTTAPKPADLAAYAVIILGDLPADRLPAETIAAIATRVKNGSLSLLTLGGLAAYGAGGWAATPLADVLPVAIAAGDGQTPGPLPFTLTPAGRDHFIFRSGRTDVPGPMDMAALPPLAGANAVGAVHPTAAVVAQSPDGRPLLAVRPWGRSRVAALTVDTTWQWVLAAGTPAGGGDTAGEAGAVVAKHSEAGADIHRRFWRQLVLWLGGREARNDADLWVMTDRPRYMIADADAPPVAVITVHAPAGADPSGKAAAAPPHVRCTGPATVDVHLEPAGPGQWRAAAPLRTPGEYTVTVEAPVSGRPERAEAAFSVDAQDYELAEVLADHDRLRRIAQAGGGTFRLIDDLAPLLTALAADLPQQSEPTPRRLPLTRNRLFLAAAILLLSAEWLLRRKWGMA